jgi:LacI family transcriptional regulator
VQTFAQHLKENKLKSRITIEDIARKLNFTPATVSRALNNNTRISAGTRKAVNEMADKLKYRRNHMASSLRTGKSQTIGVIIPSAEINFFGSVVHGIESVANTYGYGILIYQSNELPEFEKKAIQSFLGANVDGILASIAKGTKDFSHFLELKKETPLVLFDRTNDSLNVSSVVVDDFQGGYLATQHLIEQGYQRIAHISGQQHLKIFSDRLKGYKAALKDHDRVVNPSLIYKGDVSIDAGRKAMAYFMKLPEMPDAVFCVEDFTALGVLKAAREKNIHIPDELGVIGFANEAFDEHLTPSLSSIDQQTIKMGREAFTLLLEIISNPNIHSSTKKKVVLEPVPRFRESSLKKRE